MTPRQQTAGIAGINNAANYASPYIQQAASQATAPISSRLPTSELLPASPFDSPSVAMPATASSTAARLRGASRSPRITRDCRATIAGSVARITPAAVAEVLERVWGGPETLIVVSADLSHFLPYATAQQVDRHTSQRILDFATDLRPEETCGAYPLNGLLLAARQRGLQPQLLALCNSGDTAGDRHRVVGYAAFALCPEADHA